MKKIFFGLFLFNIFLNSLFLVNPVLDYSDNVVVYILDLLVLPADDIIINNAVRYFHKKCSTVSLLTMQYGIITNTTVQFNCKHCWAQNLRQGIVLKTSWISIFLIWNIILFSLFIFSIFFESLRSKLTQMLRPKKGNSEILSNDTLSNFGLSAILL